MSKFEIVSKEQFAADLGKTDHTDGNLTEAYGSIKKPQRSTSGAAGYDFYSPISYQLDPGQAVTIPTGVRWIGDKNTVLLLAPRSGLGFKYQIQLANTIGIIDEDYCLSDNEGHIMVKLVNRSIKGETLKIEAGDRIVQGMIMPYLTVEDDNATETRNGGFGSTGK